MSNPEQFPVIPDWDTYFLEIAVAVSWKSKDPTCPVGAVVADDENVLRSTGFNGFPRGNFDRFSLLNDKEEKLNWICHAEANAIFNAARLGMSLTDSTIYTTKFPCLACCQAIIQAGITRVCTHDHKYWDGDPLDEPDEKFKIKKHGRKQTLLRMSGIEVCAPFHPDWQVSEVHQPQPRVTWREWPRGHTDAA